MPNLDASNPATAAVHILERKREALIEYPEAIFLVMCDPSMNEL